MYREIYQDQLMRTNHQQQKKLSHKDKEEHTRIYASNLTNICTRKVLTETKKKGVL